MKRVNKRKSKSKNKSELYFILPPIIAADNKTRIILYAIFSLILVFSLISRIGNSLMTKTGIVLEVLSFLFLSPELFGIDDISAIQNRVLAFTERSARRTLNIFMTATKRGAPEIVSRLFYWLTWPQSKVVFAGINGADPPPYDWINSVEKSMPIAVMNLFLLWLPGILITVKFFINGFPLFNTGYPLQSIISEPFNFVFNVLSYFFSRYYF
jgi:hypothetical protein